MDIAENVDLRLHSTMRLGGTARYLAEAESEKTVKELVRWAQSKKIPFLIIGQGSNIVWRDEGYSGLVIVNKILGKKILSEDSNGAVVHFGAGEVWDEVVKWAVDKNLSGIEFLSKIPGLAGAAPVQNIGAYGAELSNVLSEVAVYDTRTLAFETILAESCNFAYRTSRFKTTDKGRFLIIGITLRLGKSNPKPPFYESLQNYFNEHNINQFTPQVIREAVTAIRKIKLPDPSVVNNNGSFFTNPFIDEVKFKELKAKYPDIKAWPATRINPVAKDDDTEEGLVKISAGWMLEKAGYKDVHDPTGMATWPGNALVLVNERARKTADLLTFRQKILDQVQEMFGISLEQEPELLP